MVARLQNIKTTIVDGSDESSAHSAEPSMIAEHANISSLPPKGANRRLRNWLIFGSIEQDVMAASQKYFFITLLALPGWKC